MFSLWLTTFCPENVRTTTSFINVSTEKSIGTHPPPVLVRCSLHGSYKILYTTSSLEGGERSFYYTWSLISIVVQRLDVVTCLNLRNIEFFINCSNWTDLFIELIRGWRYFIYKSYEVKFSLPICICIKKTNKVFFMANVALGYVRAYVRVLGDFIKYWGITQGLTLDFLWHDPYVSRIVT